MGIKRRFTLTRLLCERYEDVAEDNYSEQVLSTVKENIPECACGGY